MANVSSPITDQHLTAINEAIAQSQAALKEAELAKRAGFDMTAQVAQLNAGIEKLQQIKHVYFPNAL